MPHNARLSSTIDRLRIDRAAFLGPIEGLEQNQWDFKPSQSSWSIGEIAHHVGLGESVWLSYLQKLLKSGGPSRGGTQKISLREIAFSSRIVPDAVLNSPLFLEPTSLFINLMPRPLLSTLFAVPLFKMDAGPRMQPTFGLPRAEVLTFLEETRRNTLGLVEPVADWDLSRFCVDHPLVGKQDVYGVLGLLSSHEQRHAQQIDSIKRMPGFPKPAGKR